MPSLREPKFLIKLLVANRDWVDVYKALPIADVAAAGVVFGLVAEAVGIESGLIMHLE